MKHDDLLERIEIRAEKMAGQPVITGTRLTVHYILNLLAGGATQEEILREYEGLAAEDIQACPLFAAQSLERVAA